MGKYEPTNSLLTERRGRELPLVDFYRASEMRDGHRNDCESCNLAAQKARYEADPAAAVARSHTMARPTVSVSTHTNERGVATRS